MSPVKRAGKRERRDEVGSLNKLLSVYLIYGANQKHAMQAEIEF